MVELIAALTTTPCCQRKETTVLQALTDVSALLFTCDSVLLHRSSKQVEVQVSYTTILLFTMMESIVSHSNQLSTVNKRISSYAGRATFKIITLRPLNETPI